MQRRVKILFTIPNFKTAGSGREMFNIVERLDKAIFDPIIAVREAGGKLYEEALSKGYKIIVGPFTADANEKLTLLKSCIRIAREFKEHQIDVWQSFNWSSDYTEAMIAKFAGAKYVYVKKNMNWDRRAWKVKSYLADAIIARNKTMQQFYFSSSIFKRKTKFITGGVNIRQYSARVGSDIRERLFIPRDASVVCCIAQIVRVKDQATLIKAVADVDGVYLILAGAIRDEQYARELQALITDLGLENRAFITGSISNVTGLLHSIDVFVLPTSKIKGHEEGCPVALLEAMAAGVPSIASDVSGSRDLIIHNETGLLFQPENSSELCERIRKLLDMPEEAQKISKRALEYVQANHTLELEANAFCSLYKQLAKIN